MEVIKIAVQKWKDRDKPVLTEFAKVDIHGKVEGVAILEKGMKSGKTSLIILSKVADENIALEISANHFNAIASALKGAEQTFK